MEARNPRGDGRRALLAAPNTIPRPPATHRPSPAAPPPSPRRAGILPGVASPSRSRAVSWKANLIALWFAQVGTTLAFSFTFPFYPLFFEEIGGFATEQAAFWTGMSGWVFGVGMGLFSPVWGVLGDRFGRKLNVVRALALGAIFLALSGFSQTPLQLLASRFVIGATSGVLPTIMALVAAHTPRERLTFAAGAVQSALFLGVALGPLFGGIIYDAFGMRVAFLATGVALLASMLLVIVMVREDFRPAPSDANPLQPFADMWRMSTSRTMLPLYAVVFLVLAGNLVIQPAVPGIVKTIDGGSESGTASGHRVRDDGHRGGDLVGPDGMARGEAQPAADSDRGGGGSRRDESDSVLRGALLRAGGGAACDIAVRGGTRWAGERSDCDALAAEPAWRIVRFGAVRSRHRRRSRAARGRRRGRGMGTAERVPAGDSRVCPGPHRGRRAAGVESDARDWNPAFAGLTALLDCPPQTGPLRNPVLWRA